MSQTDNNPQVDTGSEGNRSCFCGLAWHTSNLQSFSAPLRDALSSTTMNKGTSELRRVPQVFAVFQTYISEATGDRVKSRRQGSGIEDGMMQRFKEGDRVYIIGPIGENYFRAIGIVRAVSFTGVYRYLVEFEDSRSNTFFGFELRLAQKPSVATQPEAT